jgi:hypothetical protein
MGDEMEGGGLKRAAVGSVARWPLAPQRILGKDDAAWARAARGPGESARNRGEIARCREKDRCSTWPKGDTAAEAMLTDFNIPNRRDLTDRKSAAAVTPAATAGKPETARRQSLPQPSRFPRPDYRTVRPSLRGRNRRLFLQTRERLSAKNHLGPPR